MIKWIVAFVITLVLFLCTNKRYRWFYIIYKTFPRDFIAGIRFLKLSYTLNQWERHQDTVPKLFTKLVKKHPHKIVFHFENDAWTYQQLEDFSNQVSNYFKTQYKRGDSVALILENRPEYVGLWLGLAKIGVVTALINTNLTSDPLLHSISVSKSKGIIYGDSCVNAVKSIAKSIGTNIKCFQFNPELSSEPILSGSINLTKELKNQPVTSPLDEILASKPKDNMIYIYTSGTTGMPKAALISNLRFMIGSLGINKMVALNSNDVYYDPLPLYHSAGGMIGIGQALIFGITVALRKKFSASNYWVDCKKYNCTVAHYIGEICRFLLAVYKPGDELNIPVKKLIGNGLRPEIWQQFVDTFKIESVMEFYGSTEGNSNLVNIDGKLGAVGFVPRYAHAVYPVTLIKCNETTGEPIRNSEGFCARCQPYESGILVGKIDPKKALSHFAGYADKSASDKKILINVFKKGDAYFNSGDILMHDELGYYYFKDRTGDTFRWKGENVATSEVEAVISKLVDSKESVVYGVEVPGTEGRAGMMALVDATNSLDKQKLAKGLKLGLPSYAIPLFLRVMKSMPFTGTFKLKKSDIQKDGFDIGKVEDLLYFYDSKNCNYVPLTEALYGDILGGKVKL